MSKSLKFITFSVVLFFSALFVGCQDDRTPEEKAANKLQESIEQSLDTLKEGFEDAANELDKDKKTLGERLDETIKETKEALKEQSE